MAYSQNYQPRTKILDLGDSFYDVVEAAKFPKHVLRYRNPLAEDLGLNFSDKEWLQHFGEFQPLKDNLKKPLALRYHGHQFMIYNPQLGDGRGFLFAQLEHKGKLYDLGTKGSGQTPYSRGGDGRLTLKGAVRELLATTYLEAQKVNTSKTLSVVETGEALQRNDEPSPTRSAVLVRLNHSHIRIGTFQRLAHLGETDAMEHLLYYCLKNYYPQIKPSGSLKADVKNFLQAVSVSCAYTCAQWMMAGFVHGVLNTDNINISGESFDYGPFRFLPHYDPFFTAAYFDQEGLYAYGRQPQIVYWNLQQLLLCFSLFDISKEELLKSIAIYTPTFSDEIIRLFLSRLNLKSANKVENNKLFSAVFTFLEESKCPFEDFFFDWFSYSSRGNKALRGKRKDFYKGKTFNEMYLLLKGFEEAKPDLANDPYFQRTDAVNLYIQEIEDIWSSIANNDDWQPLYNKIEAIRGMVCR